MIPKEFKFIYSGEGSQSFDSIQNIGNYRIITSLAGFLNISKDVAAIVLETDDKHLLGSIASIKRPYGWMLTSSNVPVYYKLAKESQLDYLGQFAFQGVISDNVDLLTKSQEKVETLFS